MKYELTFNLLLVRLKGRECNRRLAVWTKAESAFPNPGISWSLEVTQIRESSVLTLTGVTASRVEWLNATAAMELSSQQMADAWRINKLSECENPAYTGPYSSVIYMETSKTVFVLE